VFFVGRGYSDAHAGEAVCFCPGAAPYGGGVRGWGKACRRIRRPPGDFSVIVKRGTGRSGGGGAAGAKPGGGLLAAGLDRGGRGIVGSGERRSGGGNDLWETISRAGARLI
jgi:hypothetical protein